MSNSRPIGFGIEDVLSRIVPGALPVIVSANYLEWIPDNVLTLEALVILATFSFVFGTIFDMMRRAAVPVPNVLGRSIFSHTGNEEHLNIIDGFKQSRSDKNWFSDDFTEFQLQGTLYSPKDVDFMTSVSDKYGEGFEELKADAIMEFIESELSANQSKLTTRLKSLYQMSANLGISIGVTTYFGFASFLMTDFSLVLVIIIISLIVPLTFYIYAIYMMITMIGIPERYVASMVSDWYIMEDHPFKSAPRSVY